MAIEIARNQTDKGPWVWSLYICNRSKIGSDFTVVIYLKCLNVCFINSKDSFWRLKKYGLSVLVFHIDKNTFTCTCMGTCKFSLHHTFRYTHICTYILMIGNFGKSVMAGYRSMYLVLSFCEWVFHMYITDWVEATVLYAINMLM